MNALHRTVSLRYYPLRTNTIFDITYYYPHGLQVLSPSALETTTLMGLRYYHHQPYKLLPLGHQVLPPLTRSNYCLAQPFISVQFIVCSIVGQFTFIYLLFIFEE